MLLLFETPAGPALYKVLDEAKVRASPSLDQEFSSFESAQKLVKLLSFKKYDDTTTAVAAAASMLESKLGKDLKSFLKKKVVKEGLSDTLGVADSKLGKAIKEKLGIETVYDATVLELMRGIRMQLDKWVPENLLKPMALGLSHSLGRYKLKFSADKVDTMIVQAIGLLDELDKELNTYSMRVREWYGWHFPEMGKLISDNAQYAQTVLHMGLRTNADECDLTECLEESVAEEVKTAAQVSMGTEISEQDLDTITDLCRQVIDIAKYRAELYDYLKNRMSAIAPNLTAMVGELVGARLIAHSGSLMNLAKQPASTVQILGAEKALFRALKTKHETPKYGLIYHASLVGQAAPKLKGTISRVLAAKAALSIRVDALGDDNTRQIGEENRIMVEQRLRQLEGRAGIVVRKAPETTSSYAAPTAATPSRAFSTAGDVAMEDAPEEGNGSAGKEEKKKEKKRKRSEVEDSNGGADEDAGEEKQKKKKRKSTVDGGEEKKKKKKRKSRADDDDE